MDNTLTVGRTKDELLERAHTLIQRLLASREMALYIGHDGNYGDALVGWKRDYAELQKRDAIAEYIQQVTGSPSIGAGNAEPCSSCASRNPDFHYDHCAKFHKPMSGPDVRPLTHRTIPYPPPELDSPLRSVGLVPLETGESSPMVRACDPLQFKEMWAVADPKESAPVLRTLAENFWNLALIEAAGIARTHAYNRRHPVLLMTTLDDIIAKKCAEQAELIEAEIRALRVRTEEG